MAQVTLRSRTSEILGHGGRREVTDYEIFLNNARLRGFSTHGNMSEGYWGASAEREATKYAQAVATTLGLQVIRVRIKRSR